MIVKRKYKNWTRWFAWYPVALGSAQGEEVYPEYAWFEWVERQGYGVWRQHRKIKEEGEMI